MLILDFSIVFFFFNKIRKKKTEINNSVFGSLVARSLNSSLYTFFSKLNKVNTQEMKKKSIYKDSNVNIMKKLFENFERRAIIFRVGRLGRVPTIGSRHQLSFEVLQRIATQQLKHCTVKCESYTFCYEIMEINRNKRQLNEMSNIRQS